MPVDDWKWYWSILIVLKNSSNKSTPNSTTPCRVFGDY